MESLSIEPYSKKKIGVLNGTQNNFLNATRKKLVKSVLSAIIIEKLEEAGVVTAADIISIVKKRYSVRMSPGTVYPVLYKLELEQRIQRLPNRKKKIYTLTKKGNDLLSDEVDEIFQDIDFLLRNIDERDYIHAILEIRRASQPCCAKGLIGCVKK